MRPLAVAAGLVAALAAVAQATATTISEMQRVCPVGGETYSSFSIGSTSQFGMRLDLRPVGPAAHLPWIECPNGFIVFKEETAFTPDEIAVLTPLVASDEYQAARTEHMPAYRVHLLQRALGEAPPATAYPLLQAAWEAEDAGAEALRATYLRAALAAFEEWMGTLSAGSDDWWTPALLSAEIRRQLGDFEAAAAAVAAMPTAALPADDPMRAAAEQIARLAVQHDAVPAEFVPPPNP